MQKVIGVQYKPASKIYYFSPNGNDYAVGAEVIVDTANGITYGIVAEKVKEMDESALELPLKKVIRLATQEDKDKVRILREKSKKAIPIIEEKIKSAKLTMKLVDAEYSLDETKITIYFTADNRVDFRELLKMLASSLRVKIELRQIGARDEVKEIGGIGLCGRPCCCTSFLKDPEHITVKMVKLQNLSLSPTKTGGLCGRMMCCLAYEDPVYKSMLEEMPKVGTEITTPDGKGIVQFNDILKQRVTVKIVGANEVITFKEYLLEELKPQENVKGQSTSSEKESQKPIAESTEEKKQTKPEAILGSNKEQPTVDASTKQTDGNKEPSKPENQQFKKKKFKYYKNKNKTNK